MNQDQQVSSISIPVVEKQILIVEDEQVFAMAVQKKLVRAGHKC